jgi:hypothetical protein
MYSHNFCSSSISFLKFDETVLFSALCFNKEQNFSISIDGLNLFSNEAGILKQVVFWIDQSSGAYFSAFFLLSNEAEQNDFENLMNDLSNHVLVNLEKTTSTKNKISSIMDTVLCHNYLYFLFNASFPQNKKIADQLLGAAVSSSVRILILESQPPFVENENKFITPYATSILLFLISFLTGLFSCLSSNQPVLLRIVYSLSSLAFFSLLFIVSWLKIHAMYLQKKPNEIRSVQWNFTIVSLLGLLLSYLILFFFLKTDNSKSIFSFLDGFSSLLFLLVTSFGILASFLVQENAKNPKIIKK